MKFLESLEDEFELTDSEKTLVNDAIEWLAMYEDLRDS